ncbi:MAG: HAMP domain-containing sensor histidine kinase [Eubacterium sp.]|nr:HAMP domain-containing sensor histidine kinase [Eubacterium sp.]
MRHIFVRVFIYFGVVIVAFTILIGLMFTQFNQSNIVGTYRTQLTDLAKAVAERVGKASQTEETQTFSDYLEAVEDFGSSRRSDIWIFSNPKAEAPLDEKFTNVVPEQLDMPGKMEDILQAAFEGKRRNYTNHDKIYDTDMMHVATPVYDSGKNVIGAVLVTGPMEMRANAVRQYQKYMLFCVGLGGLIAIFLALIFSRQLVRPIIRIDEFAGEIASGDYSGTTGIVRRDELGSLADSMDELAEQLDEAEQYRAGVEQSRRDFFSNVSHELRTPITVTKGYADTLVEGYVDNPEKRTEYLKRIQDECTTMERLVSDLLIISRMQNPDFEMNTEVINLIAVAQDAMRGLRILMKQKELKSEVTYDDEMSLIMGDYDRIRQVFVVLMQNAIKYCDVGTDIRVHIYKSDGMVIAQVSDHGIVIPEEEWDQVFDKFYRATTHGGREGSGLGLVVAKNIVERHGGTINVRSTEKDGTVFTMAFPETTVDIEE